MRAIIRPAVLLAMLTACMQSTEAAAQHDPRLAVGATLSAKLSSDSGLGRALRPGLLLLQRSRDGWNWKCGLNWYSAELDGESAGLDRVSGNQRLAFGKLHVRPIMAGYGYSRVAGRATVSAHLLAGYAFTAISLRQFPLDVARPASGPSPITVDASNALVVNPEISAWIDLGHRVGLNVNTGYVMARPVIAVRTPDGEERQRLHADRLMIKIGLGYSVF